MGTEAAVTTGRWVRLMLLLSTLLGLAAMHTLGHGAHASGGHPAARHHAVAPAPDEVAMTGGCPADHCPHAAALPLGHLGGDRSGWTVCLAVLGAFAVALLVAVLLRAGSRGAGPAVRTALRLVSEPRAPPPRPFGLRLAATSVLRR